MSGDEVIKRLQNDALRKEGGAVLDVVFVVIRFRGANLELDDLLICGTAALAVKYADEGDPLDWAYDNGGYLAHDPAGYNVKIVAEPLFARPPWDADP